jgi:hypothetical protein
MLAKNHKSIITFNEDIRRMFWRKGTSLHASLTLIFGISFGYLPIYSMSVAQIRSGRGGEKKSAFPTACNRTPATPKTLNLLIDVQLSLKLRR